MTVAWDKDKIANLLCSAFIPHLARQRADRVSRLTSNIDVLVTFDAGGVSSHPNHISLYHGARAFVEKMTAGKGGWESPVDLYSLTSVNIVRKYSFIGDVFTTLAGWYLGGDGISDPTHPSRLLYMNQLVGDAALGTAWKAMTEAHRSQMVWFRYLWIGFSRYMVINDLKLEIVEGNKEAE